MASKVKALRTKTNEREKLRASYGVWYATQDENDICYAVCTTEDYPERHAFGLISKLIEKIKQIDHCEYESEENIKVFTKKAATDLALQYNDLNKIDKLAKANSEVRQLETELGSGIKKLITNQESWWGLDDKAEKLKCKSALI